MRGGQGALYRQRLWREIEEEFGEPVADVIRGMRREGYTWLTIGGALGVCEQTLIAWRRALGIGINRHDCQHYREDVSRADLIAQKQGYRNMTEAVIDVRFGQKLTVRDSAKQLGVCGQTICRYTPQRLKGRYNFSPRFWLALKVNQAKAHEATRAARAVKVRHPWYGANDVVFAVVAR